MSFARARTGSVFTWISWAVRPHAKNSTKRGACAFWQKLIQFVQFEDHTENELFSSCSNTWRVWPIVWGACFISKLLSSWLEESRVGSRLVSRSEKGSPTWTAAHHSSFTLFFARHKHAKKYLICENPRCGRSREDGINRIPVCNSCSHQVHCTYCRAAITLDVVTNPLATLLSVTEGLSDTDLDEDVESGEVSPATSCELWEHPVPQAFCHLNAQFAVSPKMTFVDDVCFQWFPWIKNLKSRCRQPWGHWSATTKKISILCGPSRGSFPWTFYQDWCHFCQEDLHFCVGVFKECC